MNAQAAAPDDTDGGLIRTSPGDRPDDPERAWIKHGAFSFVGVMRSQRSEQTHSRKPDVECICVIVQVQLLGEIGRREGSTLGNPRPARPKFAPRG
jgi:hypothetical protein